MKSGLLTLLFLVMVPSITKAEKLHNVSDYDLWVAFGFASDHSVDPGYVDPNAGLKASGWTKLPKRWSTDIPPGYTYVRVVYVTARGHYAIAPEEAKPMLYFPCSRGDGFDYFVKAYAPFDTVKTKERIEKEGKTALFFFPLSAFYSKGHRAYVCLGNPDALRDLERELKRP